jgi:hypothetical protein
MVMVTPPVAAGATVFAEAFAVVAGAIDAHRFIVPVARHDHDRWWGIDHRRRSHVDGRWRSIVPRAANDDARYADRNADVDTGHRSA